MSLESELKKTNALLSQILDLLPTCIAGAVCSSGSVNTVSIANINETNETAVNSAEVTNNSGKNADDNAKTVKELQPTEEQQADWAELRAQLTKTITAKAAAHADAIRSILAKYDACRLPEVADHDLKAVESELAEL